MSERKCRCFFYHPKNDKEKQEIFKSMCDSHAHGDCNGVFIKAMQLITECAAKRRK